MNYPDNLIMVCIKDECELYDDCRCKGNNLWKERCMIKQRAIERFSKLKQLPNDYHETNLIIDNVERQQKKIMKHYESEISYIVFDELTPEFYASEPWKDVKDEVIHHNNPKVEPLKVKAVTREEHEQIHSRFDGKPIIRPQIYNMQTKGVDVKYVMCQKHHKQEAFKRYIKRLFYALYKHLSDKELYIPIIIVLSFIIYVGLCVLGIELFDVIFGK